VHWRYAYNAFSRVPAGGARHTAVRSNTPLVPLPTTFADPNG
jgi:hypothetical protein